MKLTFHDLPAIEDVSESEVNSIIAADDFGPYAILWGSDHRFIQAGRHGPPSGCYPPEESIGVIYWEFKRRTGLEPLVAEYFDDASGKQFEVRDRLTLEEVRQAFVEYLQDDDAWKLRHQWTEL